MLVDPVPVGPALVDPVPVGPALVDPVPVDPVLVDPVPLPGGVLSVGLAPVPPPEAGVLAGGETVAEELTLTGADVDALGLAVLDGAAVAGQEGVPVGLAFLLPVALVLAFAEAVAVAVAVVVAVAVAVALSVAVDVAEEVAVVLPLGPVLLLAGLLLALPLGGLAAELTGVTLGVTDLAGLAAADDEELGEHAVGWPLLWLAEETAWLAPPPDEPAWLPDPATLGAPPLELEEVNPTAVPIWTKAARSGGNARATPMANTAQAAARAGRSSPSRQSRGCRRAPARPVPPLSVPPGAVPPGAVSWPPRMMFQRRVRTARKPPSAPEAPACLLA